MSLVRVRAHGPQLRHQQRLAEPARRRSDAISLGDHLRWVRRYRWLLAASLLAGVVAGLVAVAMTPKVWVSGAEVYANPIAIDPQRPADTVVRPKLAVTIDTEATILLSDAVLTRAVAGTSLTAAELASEIRLTAVPNSRVLKIQVRDQNADRARQLARAVTTAYLDARRNLLTQRRDAQIAGVQREITTLERQAVTNQRTSGSYRGQLAAAESITTRLGELRTQLSDLQSQSIDSGELLRAATVSRGTTRQPQVRLISWTLIGLAIGGLLAAVRDRRPAPPRTPADVHHLPIAGDLPVALLGAAGAVDDGMGGWVSIADAIGPKPVATLIVPVRSVPISSAVAELTLSVERRGYPAAAMAGARHEDPGPDGAAATMQRVRASGQHLIGAGPVLAALDRSLSATQADNVVLLLAPGTVSERDLHAAIGRVVRLGIPVLGVILDLENARPEPRFAQLTRAAT